MDYKKIELESRCVQRLLLENRHTLWPNENPSLLQMLDPAVAIQAMGMNFEIAEQLGRFGDATGRYEVAGIIDHQRQLISVSRRFSMPTRRFTAAHELGHLVMHSRQLAPLHRDRPISELNVQVNRPKIEIEADYFAACFLVPRKLLMKAFKSRFGEKLPLTIDDRVAHFLDPLDPESILQGSVDSMAMARYAALATARNFAGHHFHPLFEVFNVSASAMAIRIKEIGLVREP